MKTLLSIDPGKSTGIVLLKYDEGTLPEIDRAWQFGGGAPELVNWFTSVYLGIAPDVDYTIAEKFNARNTQGFSYTTDSLEPLRCEGVLLSFSEPDEWVQPPQQYIAGGSGKAERKKWQHRMLKDLGFYRTGRDFDTPDADDFRSAAAHGLSWLLRNKHQPTYDEVSNWNERHP